MASSHEDPAPIMLGGIAVGQVDTTPTPISKTPRSVVVTDIQIPFGRMVVLAIWWALASIPAGIILLVVGSCATGVVGAAFR